MKTHLSSAAGLIAALLCSACAQLPRDDAASKPSPAGERTATRAWATAPTFETGPFALSVTPLEIGDRQSIVQAQFAGREVLGLFSLNSQYEVQRGAEQTDAGVFGRQRFSQGLQGQLPLPLISPISFSAESLYEQRLTSSGLIAQRTQTARLRWQEGDFNIAVNAHDAGPVSGYGCGLDASVSVPTPETLKPWAASASDLRVSGELCNRVLPGSNLQAEIFGAQALWKDALGSRKLQVSHALIRNNNLSDSAYGLESDDESSSIEIGAQNAFELRGWALSQEVAVRPAERAGAAAGWAAKSQITRKLYNIPISASWQRSNATVWSVGGGQVPGDETRIGLDLSSQMQQWLAPGVGANLSYHRLQPQAAKDAVDDQIRLGVSLGW